MEKIEFEFYCEVCGMRGGPGVVVIVDARLRAHAEEKHDIQLEPLSGQPDERFVIRRLWPKKENGDL